MLWHLDWFLPRAIHKCLLQRRDSGTIAVPRKPFHSTIALYRASPQREHSVLSQNLLQLWHGKGDSSRALTHVFTTRMARARQNGSHFGLNQFVLCPLFNLQQRT
eukprot:s518_g29.t1